MNLRITLTALSVILRFTVPAGSSFWLVSTQDHCRYQMECASHVWVETHVTAELPRATGTNAFRFFQVWIEPEKGTE